MTALPPFLLCGAIKVCNISVVHWPLMRPDFYSWSAGILPNLSLSLWLTSVTCPERLGLEKDEFVWKFSHIFSLSHIFTHFLSYTHPHFLSNNQSLSSSSSKTHTSGVFLSLSLSLPYTHTLIFFLHYHIYLYASLSFSCTHTFFFLSLFFKKLSSTMVTKNSQWYLSHCYKRFFKYLNVLISLNRKTLFQYLYLYS